MVDKDLTIQTLKQALSDTLWMARRYADNRSTYAPGTVNKAIDVALKHGVQVDADISFGMYARDGMFGEWDPELKRFFKR